MILLVFPFIKGCVWIYVALSTITLMTTTQVVTSIVVLLGCAIRYCHQTNVNSMMFYTMFCIYFTLFEHEGPYSLYYDLYYKVVHPLLLNKCITNTSIIGTSAHYVYISPASTFSKWGSGHILYCNLIVNDVNTMLAYINWWYEIDKGPFKKFWRSN